MDDDRVFYRMARLLRIIHIDLMWIYGTLMALLVLLFYISMPNG